MTVKEFFRTIEEKTVKDFLQLFGGYFMQDIEAGYLYCYGKKDYLLPDNFVELLQESIDKQENLLLELENI